MKYRLPSLSTFFFFIFSHLLLKKVRGQEGECQATEQAPWRRERLLKYTSPGCMLSTLCHQVNMSSHTDKHWKLKRGTQKLSNEQLTSFIVSLSGFETVSSPHLSAGTPSFLSGLIDCSRVTLCNLTCSCAKFMWEWQLCHLHSENDLSHPITAHFKTGTSSCWGRHLLQKKVELSRHEQWHHGSPYKELVSMNLII